MEIKLIKYLEKIILNSQLKNNFNFTYHAQKYKLNEFLVGIIYVLKKGIVWRDYKKVYWNSLYKAFVKLSKLNIFHNSYIGLLKKYFRKTPAKKLRFIYTDTTIIHNINGSDKMKRNKYVKNKKVMKVSLITDINGIPFSIKTISGNTNDARILNDQLNDPFYIDLNEYSKNEKFFLADKGYDSLNLRKKLTENNFIPIIAFNKRNTKDPKKLKTLTPKQKKMYKRRIKIEMVFGLLKRSYKRVRVRYDKYSTNYDSFLFLAFNMILFKHI